MSQEKTLENLSVLVTRSAHQASKLTNKLEALGARVTEMAVISIKPPDDFKPLDDALYSLTEYDWVVFASVNAVNATIERMQALNKSMDDFKQLKIAAIGPATAEALKQFGLNATFSPTSFIAESLVSEFPSYPHLKGTRIFWPRTNVGRRYLLEKLHDAGALVDAITAYQTEGPENPENKADTLVKMLSTKKLDVITLMSSETVRSLSRLLQLGIERQKNTENYLDLTQLLSNVIFAAIGPETGLAAQKALPTTIKTIEAKTFTTDGLIQAISDHFNH
jgi:uroporphyrinogen-III synthase